MNILKKIKSLFEFNNTNKPVVESDMPAVSMHEREERIFEKERLSLQKLYEQWSCKESWLLYGEGIPLLFGIEPGYKQGVDDAVSEKIEGLWQHAQECVQKKLLSVINSEKPKEEWEVRPIDLYSWGTISRITMPEEFSTLMSFVAQTIKPAQTESVYMSESSQDIMYLKHREIVLGAATSLLVNAPDLCKTRKGNVVSKKIAQNILENEDQWFGDDKPLLSETAMSDLIDEYLKLTRPVVH